LAEITPFRGILYRVPAGELGSVLAPPYDVISPRLQRALLERDPRNVVRVVLNPAPGDGAYAQAAEVFARWRAEGILGEDPAPALYLLEQRFSREGRTLSRFGLLARFRAEDYSRGVVLPHEQTRAAAREDRHRLLGATRANFSPIFMMFSDAEGRFAFRVRALEARPPALSYTDDDGVLHRLWRVTQPEAVAEFREVLSSVPAFIADGHHRYATALRHRDEAGPDGAWTLGYFTPMDAPGLVVLPYHRILTSGPSLAEARARLGRDFVVSESPDPAAAARAVARSTRAYAFALAEAGGGAVVVEASAEAAGRLPAGTPACLKVLDTSFLHGAVLGPILGVDEESVRYVHSLDEALGELASGDARLALLLRGTPVRQIVDVARAGESMPAKSTFFHPKLPSGLVIHPLLA
jgi:uncharacterized protein (DUF1015 family)